MYRQLITLILVLNSLVTLAARELSDRRALYSFENEVIAASQEIIDSKEPSIKKLAAIQKKADTFADKWEALIKSGKAHEKDLTDDPSAFLQVLQTYTHFILISKIKIDSQKNQLDDVSCKEKQLQILIDYGDASPTENVRLTDADIKIDALRKNICGIN